MITGILALLVVLVLTFLICWYINKDKPTFKYVGDTVVSVAEEPKKVVKKTTAKKTTKKKPTKKTTKK